MHERCCRLSSGGLTFVVWTGPKRLPEAGGMKPGAFSIDRSGLLWFLVGKWISLQRCSHAGGGVMLRGQAAGHEGQA